MSGAVAVNEAVTEAVKEAVASVARGRPLPTRARGLREQAWWLMRERRKFDLACLLDTLATGQERDAENNLLKYIHLLERTGVLVRSKHRTPATAGMIGSTGHTVWMLVRDLGRHAPVWRRSLRGLWDPNAGCAVAALDAPLDATAIAEVQP